jgi:hypothetical protein
MSAIGPSPEVSKKVNVKFSCAQLSTTPWSRIFCLIKHHVMKMEGVEL